MTLDSWAQAFTQALSNFWNKIAAFLPNFIATLVIVIVGLIIARLIGRGVAIGLTKMGTDKLCERIGVVNLMRTAGVEAAPSVAIAGLIKLFLILLIVLSAAETLGLERISAVVDQIVLYLPKMLGAIAVVMGGMFIGHHVQRGVGRTMKHFGVDYAKAVSQVVYGIVLLITASLAINQLDISTGLFDLFFAIVLSTVGLAVAISFGLGAKGVASQLISGVYLREQILPGEWIVYQGEEGVVLAVGSVNTLIQVGEQVKRIPNAELIQSQFSTRNDIEDE